MESCPFCKSPVAGDLLRFGGSCPHCFIEIPGEEAPTDPGVQAPEEASPSEGSGAGIGVIAALVILLGVGGGFLAWSNNNTSEDQLADEDDPEFYIVPSSELPEDEQAPEAAPPPQAVAQSGAGTQTPYTQPPPAAVQTARPDPVQSNLIPTLGPDDEPQVIPSFGVTALSDPNLIRSMVQDVIGRYKGQIKHCYEQRLKTNETLKGTWYLSFTIRSSGAVSGVSAVGKGWQDAELESCMVRNAAKWHFQPVNEPQEIQSYPFRFGS